MPETHRVQLTGDQLPAASRGIDAGERDSLVVERNPGLLCMRDQLMIEEVAGPGLCVVASERDVKVMPLLSRHRDLPDDLRVHRAETDLGGGAAIRVPDVPGDNRRQPFDQCEGRVRCDEPVEHLPRAEVEHVHHDTSLLSLQPPGRVLRQRRRLGRVNPRSGRPVDTELGQPGHRTGSRGFDVRRRTSVPSGGTGKARVETARYFR